MSAIAVEIADAVLADLNAHPFSAAFVATREYVPKFDAADTSSLQVKVVPKSEVRETSTIARDKCTVTVDVGIMKRLTGTIAAEKDELDALMALAEEIKEFLARLRPSTLPAASCNEVTHEPLYSVEELEGGRAFLTVVSGVFSCLRAA